MCTQVWVSFKHESDQVKTGLVVLIMYLAGFETKDELSVIGFTPRSKYWEYEFYVVVYS